MFRHTVLFAWDDAMTKDMERQFAAELSALAARMPGVRAYHAGPDAGLTEGNFDFAVVGDFDDVAAYVAYRDHPEHRDIISRFSAPHARNRAAVQYEI